MHAPLIVAIAFQEDTGRDDYERVAITVASVREFMPSARVVQLTNMDFPSLPIVDDVLRVPNYGEFVDWALKSLINVSGWGNLICLGSDMIVQKDLSHVFDDGTFDFAGSRYPVLVDYPRQTRSDGAFCGDGIFYRAPRSTEFLRDVLEVYRHPTFPDRNGWSGIETAILWVSQSGKYRVRDLDFNTYNFTPEEGDDWEALGLSRASIVHFRG
jgi:hypothetical protein